MAEGKMRDMEGLGARGWLISHLSRCRSRQERGLCL